MLFRSEVSRSDAGQNDPAVRIDSPIDRTGLRGTDAIKLGVPIHQFGGPAAVEEEYPADAAVWREYSVGSALHVPLVDGTGVVGVLTVARSSVEPYTAQQIGVLQTFMHQAVIAMGNTRLFNELQERNREVTEALEHQTAMAEVLSIIASSATDATAALQAVTDRAARLCGASAGVLQVIDGEEAETVAIFNPGGLQFPLVGRRRKLDAREYIIA